MVVDYQSCQLDWAGYQVSTKWGSGPTDKFARVDVDDRGKVHVFATLTRQVRNVAYIDVVWPVSGEFAAH